MIPLPAEVQTKLANARLMPYLPLILDECSARGYLLHPTAILGAGTFGTVFLAEKEGETVAMKISLPQPGLEGSFATMCEEEGRKACALAHIPHIVAGRAYWQASAALLFFLATRYIHGTSLYSYLERSPGALAEDRLIRWALQLTQGLMAMHQVGVIHRDLKPENILLEGASDKVYIADLGIAKYARSGTLLDLRRTGTHPYAPKEQIRGSTSPKSDQYALGIVLFELATGVEAAPSVPAPRFGYPKARPARLEPRRYNPALSADFAGVIERLAALDPSDRFPSMQRAHESLLALAEGEKSSRAWQTSAPGAQTIDLTLRPTEKLSGSSDGTPNTGEALVSVHAEKSVGNPERSPGPAWAFAWRPFVHLLQLLIGGSLTLGGPALSRAGTLCLMALYYGWMVMTGLGAGFVGWAISGDDSLIDWTLAASGVVVWWFMVHTWNIGSISRYGNLSVQRRGWLFALWAVLAALAAGMLLWFLLARPDVSVSPVWLDAVCSGFIWVGLYGCIEVWLN